MTAAKDSPGSDIAARAAAHVPIALGKPELRFAVTLAPIVVTPGKLGGTAPVFSSVRLAGVSELALNTANPALGTIVFDGDTGRLTVALDGVQGYGFYIECNGRAPDPAKALRWDALVSVAGPINGRLTKIAGSGLQYFATPPADRTDLSYFTIDAMTGDSWPSDDRWLVESVTLLGFLPG
jgi:hypothetical protein